MRLGSVRADFPPSVHAKCGQDALEALLDQAARSPIRESEDDFGAREAVPVGHQPHGKPWEGTSDGGFECGGRWTDCTCVEVVNCGAPDPLQPPVAVHGLPPRCRVLALAACARGGNRLSPATLPLDELAWHTLMQEVLH